MLKLHSQAFRITFIPIYTDNGRSLNPLLHMWVEVYNDYYLCAVIHYFHLFESVWFHQ